LNGRVERFDFFFSVSPDGKRFLMELVSHQVNQPITLITNFTSALKK